MSGKDSFYFYKAFGLTMQSEFQFPELLPAKSKDRPDVKIINGRVTEKLRDIQLEGPHYQVAHQEFLLCLSDIGKFWVKDGREILVEPVDAVEENDIRIFVLGSCLGAILHQRKMLVMHASAVVFQGKAFLITGYSGAGKSTTANALRKTGLPMLTDDVCPIQEVNGQLLAFPGYPQSKLWEDAMDKLDLEFKHLPLVQKGYPKRKLIIERDFITAPTPVGGIYMLQPEINTKTSLEAIKAVARFELILEMTYRPFMISSMGGQKHHFHLATQLANTVPIRRMRRPQSNCLSKVVTLLKDDMHHIIHNSLNDRQ
jgi:energy-coupling factor transporter ATP-binding protein EcfA2